MTLPRLIIADESVPGKIPASLLLVRVMRNKGIPVNLFMCGRSAEDIRLSNLLMDDEPSYCLDTYTMSSARMMKTLFRRRASDAALNVISMPIGRMIDERTFQVNPECADVSRILNCSVVPVISSHSLPPAVMINLTLMAVDLFMEAAQSAVAPLVPSKQQPAPEVPNRIRGMIFTMLKSAKDFQLVEREFARRSPILPLGFIPAQHHSPMPAMEIMSGHGSMASVIPLKSAAIQIASASRQIEWDILRSLSVFDSGWQDPEPLSYQRKGLTVAVMGHKMSVEGDGNIELFRMMGCNVVNTDCLRDEFPISADVLYFPHTVNEPYIEQLLSLETFRAGMTKSLIANKLILATGASSMLFGDTYVTSARKPVAGLRTFPYTAGTAAAMGVKRRVGRRVEVRTIVDTCFSKMGEKMRGTTLDGFSIANPGNLATPCFAYREMQSSTESGLSGWIKGYCFVTDLKLDLWSCADVISRWLSIRKK